MQKAARGICTSVDSATTKKNGNQEGEFGRDESNNSESNARSLGLLILSLHPQGGNHRAADALAKRQTHLGLGDASLGNEGARHALGRRVAECGCRSNQAGSGDKVADSHFRNQRTLRQVVGTFDNDERKNLYSPQIRNHNLTV
jgi:hypothetical protein